VDGRVGMIASKYASGYASKDWKVIAVDNHDIPQADNSAGNVIDGKTSTSNKKFVGHGAPHCSFHSLRYEI
jgi:hypothetical protein